MINTTLNEIRRHEPCASGWSNLLSAIGKTEADNEPLPLIKILESNGLTDALWCLRALGEEHDKTVRLFACDIAEHVLHFFEDKFPNDKSPRRAINIARLYAEGGCTGEELRTTRRAVADTAADASRWAVADAAADAAWCAAAAADADATWAAALAAEATAAALAAEATAAAWDAAWDAAGYATQAVWFAAGYATADAAGETILDAERRWQKELFIKYFG